MRARIRKTLISLVLILAALGALFCGIKLRKDAFEATMDQRFTRNIANAWLWGRNAQATGVFHLYDAVNQGQILPAFLPLDYPPLRLSLATAWQEWMRRRHPDDALRQWHPDYDFNAPMLWTDTTAAILAAILAFLLVRMWVIRMDEARHPSPEKQETRRREGHEQSTKKDLLETSFVSLRDPLSLRVSAVCSKQFRGVWQGMLAGLLIWFNPAAFWNGYVWVQWDMWPVPLYLAAVLLGCLDWWFAAGACLAVGSCLKGQLLIAVPILFIWPLWKLDFSAILRLLAGAGLVFMAIIFPWLNPSKAAFTWLVLVLCAMGLFTPIALRWRLRRQWIIILGAIAVLLAWPWVSTAPVALRILPPAVLVLVALSRFLPARLTPHVYALAVALAILLVIPLFHGTTGWFTRGFEAGAERSQKMHDVGTYNLPALLQNLNGWTNDNQLTVATVPDFGKVPMKTASIVLYVIALLLCGLFAARFEKRPDTRFLLAMFLPWLFLYMLLPQMFSRYLMWAAVISGILAGVGVGLAMLGVLVSLIATAGMVQNHYQMIGYDRDLYRQLEAVEPHLGWMLVLITLICVYLLFLPKDNHRADLTGSTT